MTEVEYTYGLITADDMDTIELKEIKTTDLTEVHGLGTGLKAAKAGSYAGSAAANFQENENDREG